MLKLIQRLLERNATQIARKAASSACVIHRASTLRDIVDPVTSPDAEQCSRSITGQTSESDESAKPSQQLGRMKTQLQRKD